MIYLLIYILIYILVYVSTMIAKIMKSSTAFSAVNYNESKVKEGNAELVEIKNFGYLSDNRDLATTANLQRYFVNLAAKNKRCKKPQWHAIISCKDKSSSKEELLNIAHQYINKMGYENQPTLIYYHKDTDNNHLHIVSSRIDIQGKKISDSFEKIKSQRIINEIMGVSAKNELSTILNQINTYSYESKAQFQAILESLNYECFQKDENNLCIKKYGETQTSIPIADIIAGIKQSDLDKQKRQKQLYCIFLKYQGMVSSKGELQDTLKKYFGISLVFLGHKDSPYGYIVVDHRNKMVFKGGQIYPLTKLLQFQSKEERIKNINTFIYSKMDDDNNITTGEINRLLRRTYGTYISKGSININGKKKKLDNIILKTLKFNDKIAWINQFGATNDDERKILGTFFKIDPKYISNTYNDKTKSINYIKSIFYASSTSNIADNLIKGKILVRSSDNNNYAIDMINKNIIELGNSKIMKAATLQNRSIKTGKKQPKLGNGIGKIVSKEGASNKINENWSDKKKRSYDDMDDELKYKR